MNRIIYKKISAEDRNWVKEFVKSHWGSEKIIVHNTIYFPNKIDGFIAEYNFEKIGLITYHILRKNCEIITHNSIKENQGIGTRLVNLVIDKAKSKGCKKIRLITTNDNLKAISFYQRLGFQLFNVYPGAVEESRKLKPEIPLIGDNGLPIKDELEFILKLRED
jgi:ribosomal protein S18 acetylase RimI-like enzyme